MGAETAGAETAAAETADAETRTGAEPGSFAVTARLSPWAWVALAGLLHCDRNPSSAGLATASSSAPPVTASVELAPSATRDVPSTEAGRAESEWRRLADTWVFPNAIPNFELIDQDGKPFRLRDIGRGYLLVGLIFTTCSVEQACPLTTQKMFEVGRLWKQAKATGRTGDKELHLLSLTFDPENDTPGVLNAYSASMRSEIDNWTFATGPIELLEERLPKMFGVLAMDDPKAGKAHNVKAVLLGPGLMAQEEWKDNSFEPEAIIEMVLR
jgi:protein SCO1/2